MVDVDPGWRRLRTPEEVADAIISLYRRRGSDRYDEAVTQTEHALQSAMRAIDAAADDETIVAAFAHDIGHLLAAGSERSAARRQIDLHHEQVGARFLANWFGPGVTTPVALHVPAKRYLVATEPSYGEGLSPASVASLEVQGGPMSDNDMAAFTSVDGFEGAVQVRRWDDAAKVPGADTPDLENMALVLRRVLGSD